MSATLDLITGAVRSNYPVFLEDGVTIQDYYFVNCATGDKLPCKEIETVKLFVANHNIVDFALVILFSNNIIGYRLNI